MRRTIFMLVAALLAALPPVVAGAGNGRPAPAAADPIADFGAQLSAGRKLAFPLPDAPGPATLSPGAQALVDGAAPGALLDLVLTLDRPADTRLTDALGRLGVWSHTYQHLPSAAVRLPVARLPELRNLRGVLAIYDNQRLHYFLKESAKLNNTGHAWNDLGVTGKGITVAVIDTGVDFTHPDLAPGMKANVKIAGLGGDPLPLVVPIEGLPNSDTSSGHGTHVAGDVAGRGTASGGQQKGMAYGASLVGIGTGEGLSIITALEGFDWMLENREKYDIRVVNNSYGTGFAPFDPMEPVHLATKRATDAGIVVVFANGNDGDEMSMNPYASAPWVIPVAAGSKDGKVTDFSSGGIEADTVGMNFASNEVSGEARKPLNMGLYHPAITATGEDVVSTRSNTTITPLTSLPEDRQRLPLEQIPYYSTLSGTSMAAPEAAGIVALILEANPALTPAQVRMVLQITGRTISGVPVLQAGLRLRRRLGRRRAGPGPQGPPGRRGPVGAGGPAGRPGPAGARRAGPPHPQLRLHRAGSDAGRHAQPPDRGRVRERARQGRDQRRVAALRRSDGLRDLGQGRRRQGGRDGHGVVGLGDDGARPRPPQARPGRGQVRRSASPSSPSASGRSTSAWSAHWCRRSTPARSTTSPRSGS